MKNSSLEGFSITTVIICLLLFSCNKNDISPNRKTSEINLTDDGIALYSTYDTFVKVDNIKTNQNLFRIKVKSKQIIIPTALSKKRNYIYFPLNDTVISCRDFKTKKEIWNFNCSGVIISLKNANDSIILIGIRNKGILALNMITGKKEYEINDSNSSACNSSSIHDVTSDGKLFFVPDFNCSTIIAYNLKTGKEAWRYSSKISGAIRSLLMKDFVFCGITGDPTKKEGAVLVLDKNSGQLLFEKKDQFDLIVKPIIYKNKIIYYNYNSKLNEFNPENKTITVLHKFKKDELSCGTQLFLKDGYIYFNDCKFNLNRFDLRTNENKVLDKSKSYLLEVYKKDNKIEFIY